MPTNAALAIGLLCDLYVYFQGQTFSCYAVAISKMHMQRMSAADLPRYARHSPRSCSCLDSFHQLDLESRRCGKDEYVTKNAKFQNVGNF